MAKDLQFDLPKEESSIITVIGVGGGGSNAVNHMFRQGIVGVDFIVCNTDAQALNLSPIPTKFQIGANITEGRGAGSDPEVGRRAALENIDEIKSTLQGNTKMLFITAGMGGGTGTGAAPVIAEAARQLGILTVGIVTTPFFFEGMHRKQRAVDGIQKLKENVDTLVIINNETLKGLFATSHLKEAFVHADNVLTTAAKGIAEIITVPGYINVDFEDVKTVMRDSGVAIMGSAICKGEDRAQRAVEEALHSPILNDNDILGARYILLNISCGEEELLMDEIAQITEYVANEAGENAEIILGQCYDDSLENKLSVTLIATGFETHADLPGDGGGKGEKVKFNIHNNSNPEAERNPHPRKRSTSAPEAIEVGKASKEKEAGRSREPSESRRTNFAAPQNHEPKRHEVDVDHEEQSMQERQSWRNQDLNQIERVPAYVRRNVRLRQVPHSSDVNISRMSLSEDLDQSKPNIHRNNKYLHDNVD
jgi:cell division protein FtsZ